MRCLAAAAALLALPGCIWSPTNRSDSESTSTIPLSGYTLDPNQLVTFQAKNLTDGGMVTIATATTGSTPAYETDAGDLYFCIRCTRPVIDRWAG